jgi:hypothetical protein
MPEPTGIRLEIALMDNGQIGVGGHLVDKYQALGMLHMARIFFEQAQAEPSGSRIALPNGPLPEDMR